MINTAKLQLWKKVLSTGVRNVHGMSIVFENHGDPNKVLYLRESVVPDVGPNEVRVKMIASPIHPADINLIQGVYPMKPVAYPAVCGNEGVGVIIGTGKDIRSNLKEGDRVLMKHFGTWSSIYNTHESNVIRFSALDRMSDISAATFFVNPCTAYKMLTSFTRLSKGDFVIQNGANSGVGQAVIQIAKYYGIHSVNIIRNRPNIDELTNSLKELGATHVITEESLSSPESKTLLKSLPRFKLALNCVGGKSSIPILRYMADEGRFVTYGAMSKQPLPIPAGPLIFQRIVFQGFWLSLWFELNKSGNWPLIMEMINDVAEITISGNLKEPFHACHSLENFKEAISNSMKDFTSKKQIFKA